MAWSTHLLGGHAVVFMPGRDGGQPGGGHPAIGDTEVTVTRENYDGTVAIAAAYARAHGGHLVQDTAVPGFEEAPRDIVLGYSTMAAEALEQMAALGAGEPTHTFLQSGVGSMAAGVAAYLAKTCKTPPAMAVVEAWESACALESTRRTAGHHRRPHPDLYGRAQLRHSQPSDHAGAPGVGGILSPLPG